MHSHKAEPERSDRKGLVLRRTETEPGNTIIIRLDSNVPRNELAANVLRDGIALEILDIGESRTGERLEATVGLRASEALRIDRLENILTVRDINSREDLPIVDIKPLPSAEISELSLDALNARTVDIKSAQAELKVQLRLLKADITKASDYGWLRNTHEHNAKWWLLRDEEDAVKNQLQFLDAAWLQAKEAIALKKKQRSEHAQTTYEHAFYLAAKETLDAEILLELQTTAKEASSAATKKVRGF